jgi:hypothetical protein
MRIKVGLRGLGRMEVFRISKVGIGVGIGIGGPEERGIGLGL